MVASISGGGAPAPPFESASGLSIYWLLDRILIKQRMNGAQASFALRPLGHAGLASAAMSRQDYIGKCVVSHLGVGPCLALLEASVAPGTPLGCLQAHEVLAQLRLTVIFKMVQV